MKKGSISTIILILVLVTGLSLLLYPSFSNYWNDLHQTKAIANYDSVMANMSDEDYSHLFEEAMAYNQALRKLQFPLMYYGEIPGYDTFLNVTGNGIMGYINIEKIDIQLPIYHGTSEEVLQIAVGHVEGTSLPTGGDGTHCVLSAHRGLPSAELFTNTDHLERGDMFYIHVLGQTLEYMVDHIAVVEPYDYTLLTVTEGKDYVTLMTCTPYGINSHRLLVRGVRIGTAEQESQSLIVKNEVTQIDLRLIMTVSLGTLAALSFLLQAMLTRTRKRKERKPDET